MGTDGAIKYWRQRQNFNMILITEVREMYLTDGIADTFTPDNYYRNMKVIVIEYK